MKIRSNHTSDKWFFAVDRGGTFTDVIGISPSGEIHVHKLLSESGSYRDATVAGIKYVLKKVGLPDSLSPERIGGIRLGTTVATNALLERRGSPTALLITRGFEDLLEIGDQSRPEIFSLAITKPENLYREVFGVAERIGADGQILEPLDEDKTRAALTKIREKGIVSLAIVLMHSWKNPIHEQRVAALAREIGFTQISISHAVMPLIKIVGRGQTTLVDAYLAPILRSYVRQLEERVGGIPLEFMKSSGGLVTVEKLHAKDTILSGPAGGVIGYAAVARLLGEKEAIGFDMGGTSTDVSRFGGELARVFETETGGIKYQTDQLDVETVAAGGGSILWFDGHRFRVGPESAGADPGPACYGRGGPLTVTDANLILGKILQETLPRTFGPGNNQQLDPELTFRRFKLLTEEINNALKTNFTVYRTAEGFLRVANEIMSRAIRKISVARGYDLRRHTLICFGGAAPQHAGAIARSLGMRRIVIHPLSGVLSAYGIAVADKIERGAEAIMKPYKREFYPRLCGTIMTLVKRVREKLGKVPENTPINTNVFLDLRPLGSDTYLTVPVSKGESLLSFRETVHTFRKRYGKRFGFFPEENRIEVVNIRVEISVPGTVLVETPSVIAEKRTVDDKQIWKKQPVYFGGKKYATPVIWHRDLDCGNTIDGPALIIDNHYTTVVDPGFRVAVNEYGHLVLEKAKGPEEKVTAKRDPIMLEVFNHQFMSIAEQMGYTLANTAHSVNIKERLDFSCALFDHEGNLVANAPHIPVHLGAMGESVKHIVRRNAGKIRPGDVFVTNNPHHGGSHLPDVTVVSPFFTKEGKLVFMVASRGHHADIGGTTPGSMPPFGKTLAEEGVVIDNFLLVSQNRFREREIRELLLNGPYPARNITERLSDLRAQVAANKKGLMELERLVENYTWPVVLAYMNYVRDNAAEALREALGRFVRHKPVFNVRFWDYMDDGSVINVSITIERGENPPESHRMLIDFAGTSPEKENNLNAPVAVTKAAVLYVLRTLINQDIPLNSGCFRAVEIHIPEGSLLNPSPGAAVVGGNVETSQRVVDVLLGALDVAAASQGTMNNFLFGRPDGGGAQYYETVAGGAGAVEGHCGASAVQVHMTNTRITDPEVLEYRFPEVRVEHFKIRPGTGGKGRWPGGDGVERAIRFSEPMQISILSERRKYPPFGLAGGKSGSMGENLLIDKTGNTINLGGKTERIVQAGETIIIRTPGGGGFGVTNETIGKDSGKQEGTSSP